MADSDDTSTNRDTRRSQIFARARTSQVPLATILTSVGVVVAVFAIGEVAYRLRDIIMLVLVGGFIALLLNPFVRLLQRAGLKRRGAAVAIVTAVALLVMLGLMVAFGYPLINATTHLAHSLPTEIRNAEHGRGWLGRLLKRYHVAKWLEKNSSRLISIANGISKPALALGRGAASVLLALVTVFALVVLLLLEGPKIRRAIIHGIEPSRGRRFADITDQVSQAAVGYMLGNLMTSIIAGAVIFVTLLCLNVPFAILFALWVALVDFLPQIGGALAGIPTVLFALVHSWTAGVVTLVVFIVYTLVENHVLNPIIMSRTVKINPLTVFFSILVGAEIGAWVDGIFGGFVAVLLAVPAAATIHVLARELWNATRPGNSAPTADRTDTD